MSSVVLPAALGFTLLFVMGCPPKPPQKKKPVVTGPVKPAQPLKLSQAERQTLFDNAVGAIKAGEWAKAVQDLERLTADAPDFLEAQLNLGWARQQAGDLRGAQAAYEAALRQRNDHPVALSNLGALLLEVGQPDQALGVLAQALAVLPESLDVKLNLAVAYRLKKDFGAALRFTKEVLTREAKSIPALNNLGLIYLEQGNLEMAEWVFIKANGFKKKQPEILTNLGLTYLAKKDLIRAVAHFREAAAAQPTHVPSRMNLGAAYLAFLNYPEAAKQFQEILALDAANIEARMGYAGSLFGQRQYEPAANEYRAVLERDKDNATAYLRLGRLYSEFIRDQKQALTYLKEYIRIANPPPTDPIVQQVQFMEAQGASTQPRDPGGEGADGMMEAPPDGQGGEAPGDGSQDGMDVPPAPTPPAAAPPAAAPPAAAPPAAAPPAAAPPAAAPPAAAPPAAAPPAAAPPAAAPPAAAPPAAAPSAAAPPAAAPPAAAPPAAAPPAAAPPAAAPPAAAPPAAAPPAAAPANEGA